MTRLKVTLNFKDQRQALVPLRPVTQAGSSHGALVQLVFRISAVQFSSSLSCIVHGVLEHIAAASRCLTRYNAELCGTVAGLKRIKSSHRPKLSYALAIWQVFKLLLSVHSRFLSMNERAYILLLLRTTHHYMLPHSYSTTVVNASSYNVYLNLHKNQL